MKIFKVSLFMILWISLTSLAHAERIAVHSFEDTSCGAWKRSLENEVVRAQYIYWFRGFVSGYNYASRQNQVSLGAMPDPETLSLYIDKYCMENPLQGFVGAAFRLVEDLVPNKSITPTR
jgi:hypothetical protein